MSFATGVSSIIVPTLSTIRTLVASCPPSFIHPMAARNAAVGLRAKRPSSLDYLAGRIHLNHENRRLGGHDFTPYLACAKCTAAFGRDEGPRRSRKGEARMRASEPLTNTGMAPSCRSANAAKNARAWIVCHIDLQQCVGYQATRHPVPRARVVDLLAAEIFCFMSVTGHGMIERSPPPISAFIGD